MSDARAELLARWQQLYERYRYTPSRRSVPCRWTDSEVRFCIERADALARLFKEGVDSRCWRPKEPAA